MSQGHLPQTSVSTGQEMRIHNVNLDGKEVVSPSNGLDLSSHTDSDDGSGIEFESWGFQADRLFEVAYRFYKRNESKAFHPSFDERNHLIALILQARYGNFDDGKAPDVGALDLVGRSRRQYWATLKGMSKTEAMSKFIFTLNELCPLFKAHVEAVKISCDVPVKVEDPRAAEKQSSGPATISTSKDEKHKAIYTSLCRQTYQQFRGYALKQYPDDVQQQKYLISSLQEQYYQQYISQTQPDSNNPPKERLKSSLSPAASETSSIMHENGDSISMTSNTTEHDPTTACVIGQNNDIDQSSIDRSTLAQLSSGTDGYRSLVSTVGDNCNKTSPSSDSKLQSYPERMLSGPDEQSAEPATTQQNCDQRARKEVSDTTSESCLPKPNPYQPIDIQSIGKFESFPKPKPIPNKSRSMSTSGESKPPTARDSQREPRPAYTAIDLGEDPTYKDEPLSLSKSLPSQELPPPPPQELPPPPVKNYESPPLATPIDLQQISSEISPPNDLNSQLSFGQEACPEVNPETKPPIEIWGCNEKSSDDEESPLEQSVAYEPIEPATIWTKRGSNEFKESLVDDKQGGMYVVKQGTLVTIQVPTYPDGKFIYWEFATEDYDIGFGLDFVHESYLMEPLAIQIFEEIDEDEDCEEFEERINSQTQDDTEAALSANEYQDSNTIRQKRSEKFARMSNTVSIIPTYRRDSHEEIFVGRHRYPGKGYYLLKFDNTYSVLRSKTIFFRICYFI